MSVDADDSAGCEAASVIGGVVLMLGAPLLTAVYRVTEAPPDGR
jgi:hypothetical protein